MKTLSSALLAVTLFTVACGQGTTTPTDGGTTTVKLDTAARIDAFLEGKTLTMEGANIPSHPNGFNENQNFAASSQCYKNTIIKVGSSNYKVTAALGTIRALDGGTPAFGEVGLCDKSTGGNFAADSTIVKYDNVKGNAECFDIDVTFNVYAQEGRGAILDAGVMKLELFLKNQRVNMRCTDGNPGSGSVKTATRTPDGGVGMPVPFTGNAVQTYVISQ